MKKIVIPKPCITESEGVWRCSHGKERYDLWGGEAHVLLNREIYWPKPPDIPFPLWPYYFIENRRCDRQWYRHVNSHSLAVTLVLSGVIEYAEDSRTMTAGTGEVIVQLPGTSDRMVNADDSPSHKLCLLFDPNSGAALAPMFGFTRNTKLKLAAPGVVEKMMRQLGKLLEKQQKGSEFKVAEKAYSFFLELLRQGQGSPFPEELGALLALAEKRDFRNCSCTALAELSGVSPSTVLRIFRKHLGCTPNGYMLRRRLEEAAALLGAGCSVKETALRCNFADSSHFSRTFRRHFGVSPSEFRKEDRRPVIPGATLP